MHKIPQQPDEPEQPAGRREQKNEEEEESSEEEGSGESLAHVIQYNHEQHSVNSSDRLMVSYLVGEGG